MNKFTAWCILYPLSLFAGAFGAYLIQNRPAWVRRAGKAMRVEVCEAVAAVIVCVMFLLPDAGTWVYWRVVGPVFIHCVGKDKHRIPALVRLARYSPGWVF